MNCFEKIHFRIHCFSLFLPHSVTKTKSQIVRNITSPDPNKTLSNPQKITCIIFENLFGPYFLPHQSHSYDYAPSSGENLTSKMSFKSDATYYFHITKNEKYHGNRN